MSARDKVHQQVVNALKKDGWTITHDPFKVTWKTRILQVDLGAEKLIAAQKAAEKIAVEIKSLLAPTISTTFITLSVSSCFTAEHCGNPILNARSFWPLSKKLSCNILVTRKVRHYALRKASSY